MKISEMIEDLLEIQRKYGDVDITYYPEKDFNVIQVSGHLKEEFVEYAKTWFIDKKYDLR